MTYCNSTNGLLQTIAEPYLLFVNIDIPVPFPMPVWRIETNVIGPTNPSYQVSWFSWWATSEHLWSVGYLSLVERTFMHDIMASVWGYWTTCCFLMTFDTPFPYSYVVNLHQSHLLHLWSLDILVSSVKEARKLETILLSIFLRRIWKIWGPMTYPFGTPDITGHGLSERHWR